MIENAFHFFLFSFPITIEHNHKSLTVLNASVISESLLDYHCLRVFGILVYVKCYYSQTALKFKKVSVN